MVRCGVHDDVTILLHRQPLPAIDVNLCALLWRLQGVWGRMILWITCVLGPVGVVLPGCACPRGRLCPFPPHPYPPQRLPLPWLWRLPLPYFPQRPPLPYFPQRPPLPLASLSGWWAPCCTRTPPLGRRWHFALAPAVECLQDGAPTHATADHTMWSSCPTVSRHLRVGGQVSRWAGRYARSRWAGEQVGMRVGGQVGR